MHLIRRALPVAALCLFGIPSARPGPAGTGARRLAAVEPAQVRQGEALIARMLRAGELSAGRTTPDTLLAGREHDRLRQLYKGVPVFGGEVVRQRAGARTVSIFASLYEGVNLDPVPRLSAVAARSITERLTGGRLRPDLVPELFVVPRDEGGYALAYRLSVFARGDLTVYFIDAHTGEVALAYSNLQGQVPAVGLGTGVLSDRKKMSVASRGGIFIASDALRPPSILTYDLKGDAAKVLGFLEGGETITDADLATDADNEWSDGVVVDAHTYAGWTYDYYFQRFGRRGLDNADISIFSLVHPVRREDIASYPDDLVDDLYLNAFYLGGGVMLYGEGFPPDRTLERTGQQVNYFAAGLDVVAHELTHGVTDFTSMLIYRGESGALNESFSDVMGTGVEFFLQPPGAGPLKADYLIGEDIVTPGGLRSMADPSAYGDPDHYSVRLTFRDPCTRDNDNCGVHINSGIPNHVFYLAIEGGRNRVSGLAVQGVGAGNRDQIEKAFYRAFTQMLPSSADFSTARAATIQSARDLFREGSAAERALTQAWAAVGVN
jgi:bacillolysin